MRPSRWGRRAVAISCCYGSAYAKGHRPRAGGRVGIGLAEGRGRPVITSSALEHAFEIDTGQASSAG